MDKRILVAFALSFFVLFILNRYTAPPAPLAPETEALENSQTVPENTGVNEGAEDVPASPRVGAADREPSATVQESNLPEEETSQEDTQAGRSEELALETRLYQATFSNEGGGLRSLRLRNFLGSEGEPLELINQEVGANVGWPLALTTGDGATDELISDALYVAEQGLGTITFEFRQDGLYVRKEFRTNPETYRIEVDASITRDGQPIPFSIVWQGGFGDQSADYEARLSNIVYRDDGDYERLLVGGIEGFEELRQGRAFLQRVFRWLTGTGGPDELLLTTKAGLEDQYFLAMFLAAEGMTPTVSTVPFYEGEDEIAMAVLNVPMRGSPFAVYVGPKEQSALADTDPVLSTVIDYGFFEILARPLLFGLLWIQSYISNFGWSIVLLTLFINLVLFPLRLKQQLSMQKMQKIQPQMRTLQDKFKKLKSNDPRKQEVQAEMMGLYKKHGVNPMGGCLPLLLQMPFLFAFFSLLRTAIELRGAPWMLWIQDLSAPDPFYVMPVLMGGSMFFMQKMMPTTADPNQAKMMAMMPIVLTAMFVIMPVQSGLMVYWLTSNLVGIGQQYFIKKYWAPTDSGKKARPDDKGAIPVTAEIVEEKTEPEADDSADPKRRKRRGRRK